MAILFVGTVFLACSLGMANWPLPEEPQSDADPEEISKYLNEFHRVDDIRGMGYWLVWVAVLLTIWGTVIALDMKPAPEPITKIVGDTSIQGAFARAENMANRMQRGRDYINRDGLLYQICSREGITTQQIARQYHTTEQSVIQKIRTFEHEESQRSKL